MDENINLEGNTEIKKALEEFDVKSGEKEIRQTGAILEAPLIQPKHEVEGVKFETDSYGAIKFYNQTSTPKMIKSVMKWSGGAIKEERQAEYVLLVFVVIALIFSAYLFFGKSFGSRSVDEAAYRHILELHPELIGQ